LLALLANGLLSHPAFSAARPVPPGTIVFSHEESGSTIPSQLYSNFYAMDAQNPAPPVKLTNFGFPARVELPVWSKDYTRIAFDSDVNDGLRSLEVKSAYSIAPNGGNLAQMTGYGVLGSLPGATRTITGHVQAPSQPLLGAGSVTGCVISVQGAPQTVSCQPDNSFTINNVPLTSAWVRVQAWVTYAQTIADPGLSLGWAAIGASSDVGLIEPIPEFPRSVEPSWSRDGRQVVVLNQVTGKYLYGLSWQSFTANQLNVWNADGSFARTIPNVPGLQAIGSDWSPTQDRICFAGNGSGAGSSSIYLENADGSNLFQLYQVPLVPLSLVTLCRWSPNGQRIAFIQLSENLAGGWWSDLYVINADRSGLKQLTFNAPGNFSDAPSWSPDGSAVAIEIDVNPGYPITPIAQSVDLFAVDPSTLAVVQLTNDHRSSSPAWGPSQTFLRSVGPALPSSPLQYRPGPPPVIPPAPPGPRFVLPAAPVQALTLPSSPRLTRLSAAAADAVWRCFHVLSSLLSAPA
jgi:Tol biopolymer transport system component